MVDATVGVEVVGEEVLIANRQITVGDTALQTPSTAFPTRKLDSEFDLSDEHNAVNEIYRQIRDEDLARIASNPNDRVITDIEAATRHANPDELTLVVLAYQGEGILNVEHIRATLQAVEPYSDLLVSPLMPRLHTGMGNAAGTDSEYFDRYVNNLRRFYDVVESGGFETPVMGTLPVFSWRAMDELLSIHLAHDTRAFCLNFNGKKITGRNTSAEFLAPLFRTIANQRLYETTFTYAINASRGQPNGTDTWSAEDVFGFGAGIDILGGDHFPRWPDEEIDNPTFRLFDPATYQYTKANLDEVDESLPDRTIFDHDRVLSKMEHERERRRIQTILEAEQKARACDDLRSAIRNESVESFLEAKRGGSETIIARLRTVFNATTQRELGHF